MRLAFVDLLFSWPPHGGADVDFFHALSGLQRLGHEVHAFILSDPGHWERGSVDTEALPFPATLIPVDGASMRSEAVCADARRAVDAMEPEAVFVCDGFFLKPFILKALSHYPLASRYYAHELACHRGILRFKDGAPCPNHYLDTPDVCRACALDGLGPELRRGHRRAWVDEYRAARAYAPEYHSLLREALALPLVSIVYNHAAKADLARHAGQVEVIPGGVDPAHFTAAPPPDPEAARKVILMAGRGEDPAKGADVLRAAGARLARERSDFEVQVTMPEDMPAEDWFRLIGWHGHDELPARYHAAHICVAPSVWDEPFGLVAVEAMASARPVCAARVGGLQEILVDRETGFLFDRGDDAELAKALSLLLDNADMRARMGAAGRKRVEECYTWDAVVARYYPPILERLRAAGKP